MPKFLVLHGGGDVQGLDIKKPAQVTPTDGTCDTSGESFYKVVTNKNSIIKHK